MDSAAREENSLFLKGSFCSLTRGDLAELCLILHLPLLQTLEKAVCDTIEAGDMTKDLAICIHGSAVGRDKFLYTEPFLDKVSERFERKLLLQAM